MLTLFRFWSNAIKTVGKAPQKRFINAFQEYTDAVVQQAMDRDNENVRDIESYFNVRRQTIGTIPSFAVNEMYLNLPDYVFDCQAMRNIITCSSDMTIIGNDICSYNVEYVLSSLSVSCLLLKGHRQARGDDQHNIVTIVMRQQDLNIQDALDWVGDYCRVRATQFLEELKNIPSWGDSVNSDVSKYIDALGDMPRANYQWSFEVSAQSFMVCYLFYYTNIEHLVGKILWERRDASLSPSFGCSSPEEL